MFLIVPVSRVPSGIIRSTCARRSHKVKMDNQNGALLRLTLKERAAGAAVLGRAFAEYEVLRHYFPDETQRHTIANTFVLTRYL